jgi:Lipopolysaccharide-assembly
MSDPSTINKHPMQMKIRSNSHSSLKGNLRKNTGLFSGISCHNSFILQMVLIGFSVFALSSCKIYSFKDVSIPDQVKTIKISYIENKAQFVDPQLSPQLTDKLKQKITNQTRLTQVESDEADYDVQGFITDYNVTTTGVANNVAATNRLTVTVHIIFRNRMNDQKIGTPDFEADVSRNFDFAASLTISDAQAQLTTTIVSNMTDEIFNKLFSNW